MQNQVQQFHNTEFGSLEILMIDGKPYFPATACAVILGYKNPHKAILDHCKGLTKREGLSAGGIQNKNYIPEGDLYRLLIRSKLPAAVRFEAWVFDTVLPSIRRQNIYITDALLEELAAHQNLAHVLFRKLWSERSKTAELETLADGLTHKAAYYDLILQSKNTISVGVIAKDYGMSATQFNKLLHALRVQCKSGGTWLLYQSYAGKGYTRTRTYFVNETTAVTYTSWTQAGRLFLYEKLKKRGIVPMAEVNRQTV